MRARGKELSEKYKALRLYSDSFYGSRLMQTFLNKFIQKGKKTFARKQVFSALTYYRMAFRRPQLFFALLRLFQRLRVQFILLQRRQARDFISVPFPVRRNKRDVMNLQTLYRAISDRKERELWERTYHELTAIAFQPRQASTLKALTAHLHKVYGERVNMDRRWK